MSLLEPSDSDKVLPLRPLAGQEDGSPTAVAARIRRQISLLHGYADLMDGVSPAQAVQIMRVMADKVADLTETIRPFIGANPGARPGIDRYRKARTENRELMAQYRELLARLRDSVGVAKAAVPTKHLG